MFLINETQNGNTTNIIYDDKGDVIAWQSEEENMELHVARDIELDKKLLQRQIELAQKRDEQRNNESDTQKAGEGRDLASKEHEEKKEEKDEEEQPKKEEDKNQEEKVNKKDQVENLKGKINIEGCPKFLLDEIINGHKLWDILKIEYKLKGKLPEDVNVTKFEAGFLSIIDIDAYEQIIGDDKEKLNEVENKRAKGMNDIFVIESRDGDIFVLDDNILKPKEMGSTIEKQQVANSSIRYADGKETEKPDSNTQVTRTSLYEIPDASDNFKVDENWYLAVDNNMEWTKNGTRPPAGNIKEVSFVQVSRNEDYFNREVRVQNALEYKLEAMNEATPTKEEMEQNMGLREKNAYEAQDERKGHMETLTDEICKECKGWDELYNKNDIEKMVDKYHKQGLNDKEVKEQVIGEIEVSKEVEHGMPNLYEKKF